MRSLIVAVCLLATACASPDAESRVDRPRASHLPTSAVAPQSPSTSSTASKPSERPPTGRGTSIVTADSDYGTMLFDASGQPIYLFTAERDDRPACYGACAGDWPPVLTTGAPQAAGAAHPQLLDTVRRADGTTQLTYGGHPLYFYAHEGKYEVLCHDVTEYGGTWLVVRPDGEAAAG